LVDGVTWNVWGNVTGNFLSCDECAQAWLLAVGHNACRQLVTAYVKWVRRYIH